MSMDLIERLLCLSGNVLGSMRHFLRRRRSGIASVVLGLWIFALFVGIAHACSGDGITPHAAMPMAGHASEAPMDEGMAPGCEQFCSNDLPLVTVLKLVQDQPAEQPLVIAAFDPVGVVSRFAPGLRAAVAAHPPPGPPISIRFARLTL